jgi:microcystin-dependent protein
VEPFIAEIRIFPFDFAPRGWAFCNGDLVVISQNAALFSVLGTTYGGDGSFSFGLPNLQGRVPVMSGQGPGLPEHSLGEVGGATTVTLDTTNMPMHWHVWNAAMQPAEDRTPANEYVARATGGDLFSLQPNEMKNVVSMAAAAISPAGGGRPHNNMQPYLAFNFCIALQGIFPTRS